jgi:glycosyltransferase involved in cell wall biosynthesis
MAAGTPVIAFGRGGALDTVVDGETGVFFHEQSVDALVNGLRRFEEIEPGLHTEHLRQHARRFARAEFERQFGEFVQRAIERRHP